VGVGVRRNVGDHAMSTYSLGGGAEAYQARCSCGWLGLVRKVAAATEGDVERHARTTTRTEYSRYAHAGRY
jgi:hypothetical protein